MIYYLIFRCRKCESMFSLSISEEATTKSILKKLAAMEKRDCPVCGEEPYTNWYFCGVRKSKDVN